MYITPIEVDKVDKSVAKVITCVMAENDISLDDVQDLCCPPQVLHMSLDVWCF